MVKAKGGRAPIATLGPAGGAAALAAAGTFLVGASIATPTDTLDPPHPLETVRLDGIDRRDNSGYAIAHAGDVDGDGRSDILIGAYAAAGEERPFAGETYLLFGRAIAQSGTAGGTSKLALADIAAHQGIRLAGRDAGDRSGVSVASAGDVDGDGLDDILVGAHFAARNGEPHAGETMVVFGKTLKKAAMAGEATLDLSRIAPAEGVTLLGPPGKARTGWSVAPAGDVDGDGRDDVLVGAHAQKGRPGLAFVVFADAVNGAARGDGVVDLGALAAGEGVALAGAARDDFAGLEVAGAGDVDGDGHADVLVGAFGTAREGERRAGAAYIVPGAAIVAAAGAARPALDMAALAAHEGVVALGATPGDNTGRAVAGAGDVDGDGRDDVLLGAWSARPGGRHWSGEARLLLARALARTAGGVLDLKDPVRGTVTLRGARTEDFAGWSVAAAGDVDGDGLGDVLVGAYGADPAGAAYLLFGAALAARAEADGGGVVELSALRGAEGVVIEGALAGSNTGFRVSAAGDVDGDGRADVLVAAPYADLPGGREAAGQTFLVSGSALLHAATQGGVLRLGDERIVRHAVDPRARRNDAGSGPT